MDKKLLALGCSYTRNDSTNEPLSFFWPYHLAQNLGNDWRCTNIGHSGSSLQQAKESFLNYITYNDNPDLVVWGGTCWDRMYFGLPFKIYNYDTSLSHFNYNRLDKVQDSNLLFGFPEEYWNRIEKDGIVNYLDLLIKRLRGNLKLHHKIWAHQMRQLSDVKMLCDKLNIKFVYYQLTQMIPYDMYSDSHVNLGQPCVDLSNYLVQTHGEYIMNNKKYFPNLLEASLGEHFLEQRPKNERLRDYQVSEWDSHPNLKGHKLIGDILAKYIIKNFDIQT